VGCRSSQFCADTVAFLLSALSLEVSSVIPIIVDLDRQSTGPKGRLVLDTIFVIDLIALEA
jgi:hypothetical protein